jgi:ribosomal protein L40E
MPGEIETRLARGIEAAQAGEDKRAREILTHIIELDQYNEQAWMWLSSVVDTPADKMVCLENVLFINPKNTQASAGLERLRRQPVDPSRALLPRLAAPRPLGEWDEEEEDEWEWAGKQEGIGEKKWAWDASATASSPMASAKICPRCSYRNPSWVYVCDRCGADLQPVDLREAISSGAKPRGRSSFTLLAAWGGAVTFNRLLAYQPEIELASWGRSLAALVMAALFTSVWRTIITVAPRLTTGARGSWGDIGIEALRCMVETLPLAMLLTLLCAPLALFTWIGACLAGGKQSFKTHTHLTSVAFSALLILVALLAPLAASVFPSRGDADRPDLPGTIPTLISAAIVLIETVWLAQALRTAHRLSAARTALAMLLAIALSAALVFGLRAFAGEPLTRLVDMLVVPFLPWSG